MFFDIKEDEMNIKYGMYNLIEEREDARGSLKYILSDFADIKKTYFSLGFHLDEFIRCKYYEDFGYLTFKDFALENIPLDYSAVNRCINVFNMTCQRDGLLKKAFIKEEYKDYSYSQLVEMVSLDDMQRKQIKPTMSVRQIRNIKNGLCDSSSVHPVTPAVPEVTQNQNCDVAIEDEFLTIELVDMIKCKYKGADIRQLSHTARCIWFEHAGKQYKIMLMISDIKE